MVSAVFPRKLFVFYRFLHLFSKINDYIIQKSNFVTKFYYIEFLL